MRDLLLLDTSGRFWLYLFSVSAAYKVDDSKCLIDIGTYPGEDLANGDTYVLPAEFMYAY